MEKQGKIFILSGPSGCGKGTVLKSAMREHPDMFLSVSATTRGPRQGEIDGVHYHFIDDDAFLKMIDRDQLLEHAGYAGNFYGTPRIPVDEALDQGRDVMLEIDVQGAQQVYAKRPDAVRIFLAPPSWSELERRLVNRGTDSADKIRQRLTRARTRWPWPWITTISSSTTTWSAPPLSSMISSAWSTSSPPSGCIW